MSEDELQEIADKYGLYTEKDVENRVSCELLRIGARNEELEQENAELKETLKICEENADTYFDELTKLQEQLVKTTQIGMTCLNCKWSQYDEDEMCYCCSNKDKWELKIRR